MFAIHTCYMLPQNSCFWGQRCLALPSLIALTEVLEFYVTMHGACLWEGGTTVCAAKGLLARMHPLMREKIWFLSESFIAPSLCALVECLASLRYPAVPHVAPAHPYVEHVLFFNFVHLLHSVWSRSLVLRFATLLIFLINEWILGLGTTKILELVFLIESSPEIVCMLNLQIQISCIIVANSIGSLEGLDFLLARSSVWVVESR